MKATVDVWIPHVKEWWTVPRGFGQVYLVEAKRQREGAEKSDVVHELTRDMLGLAMRTPPTQKEIAGWTLRQRVEAMVWAATEHARASDNPVRRHPKLEWLEKLQAGTP